MVQLMLNRTNSNKKEIPANLAVSGISWFNTATRIVSAQFALDPFRLAMPFFILLKGASLSKRCWSRMF
jgi:hypothetical protein